MNEFSSNNKNKEHREQEDSQQLIQKSFQTAPVGEQWWKMADENEDHYLQLESVE